MHPINPFRHSETPSGSLFTRSGEEALYSVARAAFDAAEQAYKVRQEQELKRRQDLIDWARTAGKDEAWVDKTF
jgi:hypothetical protein